MSTARMNIHTMGGHNSDCVPSFSSFPSSGRAHGIVKDGDDVGTNTGPHVTGSTRSSSKQLATDEDRLTSS